MANNENSYVLKDFASLCTQELHDILKLRQDVFVVEQNCPFHDIDGNDHLAYHLMMYQGDALVGYTRLFNAGESYSDALAIGRVVVSPDCRGRGLSYELMKVSIVEALKLYGSQNIKIGAQAHLESMYENVGFKRSSDEYDEDGIAHIEMTYYV